MAQRFRPMPLPTPAPEFTTAWPVRIATRSHFNGSSEAPLADRVAAQTPLDHASKVVDLLHHLRRAGAEDRVTARPRRTDGEQRRPGRHHLRTDVMPLRRWSKMLILLQSAVFIVEPALVICRAANIFD
jgi:hypothetical protein